MRNDEHTGPEVKLCKRPSCRVPFSRQNGMKQRNWEAAEYCPRHRKKTGKKKPAEPLLGHYEVNCPVINAFLYGKAP